MINITFKNVGQGDSIFINWFESDIEHIGIVDCCIKDDTNPVLEEIKARNVKYIDFIVLSHMHFDHFSGMPSLFQYCIENNIQIGIFYHTYHINYLTILGDYLISQNEQKVAYRFLEKLELLQRTNLLKDDVGASPHLKPYPLIGGYELEFLSPIGRDHTNFAHQQANFLAKKAAALPDVNSLSPTIKKATLPDVNALSTIIKIANTINGVVLTSDSTRKAQGRVIGKINQDISCLQVPHHGSGYNHHDKFLKSLTKSNSCLAVFSVGDLKRDKLPKREVVEYFDMNGFDVRSTNPVYGIAEYFELLTTKLPESAKKVSAHLSSFSTLAKTNNGTSNQGIDKYSGDVHMVLK